MRKLLRRAASLFSWSPLSTSLGFFRTPKPPAVGAVSDPEAALTLSPFWCGIRHYCNALGSLPLITYEKLPDGGRKALEGIDVVDLETSSALDVADVLNNRPNPAMMRSTLMELAVSRMFLEGEAIIQIQKNGNGDLLGLYPIPRSWILQVYVDAAWKKWFVVRVPNDGIEVYSDDEILHWILFTRDGIRGVPILHYAGESLGLHRQILEGATSYYQNSARPSGYIKYPTRMSPEDVEAVKKYWKEEYFGSKNVGKVPVLGGAEFIPFVTMSADDQRIIEALSSSVDDCARWLNISPLLLFNLARGTYSNLGAENVAFYQRSLRPILEKIELELNWKVFGRRSRFFAQFATSALLRGDPFQQAQVANIGIQNGSVTRNEQRAELNLPPLEGLDEPLTPLNMTRGAESSSTSSSDPSNIPADPMQNPGENPNGNGNPDENK